MDEKAPSLPPGVRMLVTTRSGGVSRAPWDFLNLGDHVGDDRDAVIENRRLLTEVHALPRPPRWLQQVHGVAVADLDTASGGVPVADASVTAEPGTVCAVLTADCLPVLLAAADGSAVAAAHAGWRGLAAGVLENTVAALRARVPPDVALHAWFGPAIGPLRFEVGDEVLAAFVAQDAAGGSAFTRGAGDRWHADLYELARQRLAGAGVTAVSGGGACTYDEEERYFSHRRDVQHRGQGATGRMASLIWLQP
ncbi:MAG: peptidoglycan editing factor PgeF [Steroidobacteraceae bacterium]